MRAFVMCRPFVVVAIAGMLPLMWTHRALAQAPVSITEGAACHVLSGTHKGKTGTYDEDGFCCGDWGCTECVDRGGNRCADGPAAAGSIQDKLNATLAGQFVILRNQHAIFTQLQDVKTAIQNSRACTP